MRLLLALLLAITARAQTPEEPPVAPGPTALGPPNQNFVAVVVGLSNYKFLPAEVHLDFARSDAATVAQALRDQAHFTSVFLLRDGEATRESIRETLRNKAAQLVGPTDVFVLYFAGHGVGADLDVPTLLAFDSTMANGQEDGLLLTTLTRDIQTWTRAGNTLIVTDAIHRNQLDGIYFYGPAADEWPAMPRGTMVLSSSAAGIPARDGAFGQVFAQAMGGTADTNRDGAISAGELYGFLVQRMTPSGQIPVAAGDFSPDMVLARGVVPVATVSYVTEGVDQKPPEPTYPDFEIAAAKFVWNEGASQQVQCRDEPVVACSPSCYVRTFKAGPCEISALIDGVEMRGRVVVFQQGKYDCARKGGDLVCTGP